jgi:hypothetical protein
MVIETVGQLVDAVQDRFGDRVQVNESYKGRWTGGYHFSLGNGFVVSVQFAPGLAGDYRSNWLIDRINEGLSANEIFNGDYDFSDSRTAEVVVMKNGDWYDLDKMVPVTSVDDLQVNEQCLGEYVPADDVFKLIEKFSEVSVVC